MLDIKTLGANIRDLRVKHKLTQSEFAKMLDVSFQAVSNWERGVAPPELENLTNISSCFGVLVDELLCPKNESLYLGIDGGGTKTEFVLVSDDGHVQKRVVKEGCNPNDIGFARMAALINGGIDDILKEFPSVKGVFCGISGITTGNNAKSLYAELKKRYPKINIQIKTDSFNLFALDDTADMALISGTGSVVFVKCGDDYKRLGGWGYLLDSAGSAYDIGRAALQQALYEEDMLKEASLMNTMLREKLDADSVWERINIIYTEGKPYIACLAPVVFEAYQRGDENAVRIIDENAKALANLLNAGVELYGVKPVAIASGGIFEHHGDVMLKHIEKYSSVRLIISGLAPIYGACKSACSMDGGTLSEEFCENFKKSYGGIIK